MNSFIVVTSIIWAITSCYDMFHLLSLNIGVGYTLLKYYLTGN